jgi:hypothetical protein
MFNRRNLLFSILVVVCLLLGSINPVHAAPVADNPVVTPVTEGSSFTTTIISLEALPGTLKNEAGGVYPVSVPDGSMQFSGDGIKVSSLVGTAKVCFATKSPSSGWSGTVYQYLGNDWVALDSTTSENSEGLDAQACATIYRDGVFALVLGYTKPDNKVMGECTDIEIIYPYFTEDEVLPRLYILGGVAYPGLPIGTKVTYSLINITPAGSLSGSLKASGEVINNVFNPGDPTEFYSVVSFPEGTYVDYQDGLFSDIRFTVRFYTPGCYKDFHYPDDLPN